MTDNNYKKKSKSRVWSRRTQFKVESSFKERVLYILFDSQNHSVVDNQSSPNCTSAHQLEWSSMHLWSGRLPPGGDNKYLTTGTLFHLLEKLEGSLYSIKRLSQMDQWCNFLYIRVLQWKATHSSAKLYAQHKSLMYFFLTIVWVWLDFWKSLFIIYIHTKAKH